MCCVTWMILSANKNCLMKLANIYHSSVVRFDQMHWTYATCVCYSGEKLVNSLAADVTNHSWLNVADSTHFHISSVRTLAVAVTSSSVLIFSAGGRGQLCAWVADVVTGSSAIGRLRWLASHAHHVTRRRKSTNHKQSELTDIRYMKVTAFSINDLDPDLPDDLYILAVACSDAFFRFVATIWRHLVTITVLQQLMLSWLFMHTDNLAKHAIVFSPRVCQSVCRSFGPRKNWKTTNQKLM